MTALTADRKTDQLGTPDSPMPTVLNFPVEANTSIFGGSMVATNAAGNAVPASSNAALKLWGRCKRQVLNTVAGGSSGAAGALQVQVETGVYYFTNGTGADAIAAANVGSYCYASDDNTVTLTDGNGTRPLAGVIYAVGEFGLSPTGVGQIAVGIGFASPYVTNPELPSSNTGAYKARNVVTSNVATPTGASAYTVAAAASNDNVLGVAGDIVLLVGQTTATQNGPYIIGTVATGTAALSRPDWWTTGTAFKSGQQIAVGGEGTVNGSTMWTAVAAGGLVDTNDPQFRPFPFPNLQQYKARAVLTSLQAYTGTGTSTLTETANGALAVQDGVTIAVGDVILFPAGVTNVTAADSGPWVVTGLGSAGSQWTMQRPLWYATGATAQFGATLEVGPEGTLFKSSTWKTTTKGSVIGTTDAAWFPRSVTQQITLAAGVLAVANVPILSATKSNFLTSWTTRANCASTVQYNPVSIVAGAIGTATVTVQAQVAAGTIQNTDTSVGNFTITNQV